MVGDNLTDLHSHRYLSKPKTDLLRAYPWRHDTGEKEVTDNDRILCCRYLENQRSFRKTCTWVVQCSIPALDIYLPPGHTTQFRFACDLEISQMGPDLL